MKGNLPIKEYKSPGPGLLCPKCYSSNTIYSCLNSSWECFDCAELFTNEEAYTQPKASPLILIGKTEDGGAWYKNVYGSVAYFAPKDMETFGEPLYPPLSPDTLDKIRKECKEKEEEYKIYHYLQSLNPEQISQLKEQLC